MMRVAGALVVYTSDTMAQVADEFTGYIKSLSAESAVVIINNNDAIPGFIQGSNHNHEFSGWDEALCYIDRAKYDVFVFANDTFCTRNQWGKLKKHRLRKALLRMSVSHKPMCAGELCKANIEYSIYGLHSKFWVRTHIFALNADALHALGGLSLSDERLNGLVSLSDGLRFVWSNDVSNSLVRRINDWLFPPSNSVGWYKAASLCIPGKLRKARTILNEKWLAAMLIDMDCEFINIGDNLILSQLVRLHSSLRRRVC